VRKVETLASIIGENELSEKDKKYLEFGKAFEEQFIKQGPYEERDVRRTLDLAWEMVSILPREELIRVTEKQINRYYAQKKEGASV
jgi:V/A-type H+-transporting ATPase subunit B